MNYFLNIKNELRVILNVLDKIDINLHLNKSKLELELEEQVIQLILNTTQPNLKAEDTAKILCSKIPNLELFTFNNNEKNIKYSIEEKKIYDEKIKEKNNYKIELENINKILIKKIKPLEKIKQTIDLFLFKINLHSFEHHSFLLTQKRKDEIDQCICSNNESTLQYGSLYYHFFSKAHEKTDEFKKDLIIKDLINSKNIISPLISDLKKQIALKDEEITKIKSIKESFCYKTDTDYYLLDSFKKAFIDVFIQTEHDYNSFVSNLTIFNTIMLLITTTTPLKPYSKIANQEYHMLIKFINVINNRFNVEHLNCYMEIISLLLKKCSLTKEEINLVNNKELISFLNTQLTVNNF
jgi:hypothetical protein